MKREKHFLPECFLPDLSRNTFFLNNELAHCILERHIFKSRKKIFSVKIRIAFSVKSIIKSSSAKSYSHVSAAGLLPYSIDRPRRVCRYRHTRERGIKHNSAPSSVGQIKRPFKQKHACRLKTEYKCIICTHI